MAFGILIYEKDEYLYTLIRERLSFKFPEAYIEQAENMTHTDSFKLIEQVHILYDNRQYKKPSQSMEAEPIPLFRDDGKGHFIIDMRLIYDAIYGNLGIKQQATQPSEYTKDRLRLLISYAYIDEREAFIKEAVGPDSFDCLYPMRIDLMSGIRMPNTFTPESKGSISKLLRACQERRFEPEHIPDYLNPDSSGFLSCGKPENEDDVFDIGIDSCDRLMELLSALCTKEDTGALVVVEGWRVSELTRLIKWCDTLHILLPARMCTEDTGMTKELGHFKRALRSGALMTIDYCEDYRHQYDSISM